MAEIVYLRKVDSETWTISSAKDPTSVAFVKMSDVPAFDDDVEFEEYESNL